MKRLVTAFLLAATAPAFAQMDCAVCEQALKLRESLRKVEIGNAGQKAQGEAISREGLALVTAFRDSPPPAKPGRKSFEALVALSLYAAPFAPGGEYEKAIAAITVKDPEYRKRYQALVRKGMRAKNRRESCQVRYLQTNVSVQECRLQETGKGSSAEIASQHCDTSYALDQCMAKKN